MRFPSTSTFTSSAFSNLKILALNQTEITWTEVIAFPDFFYLISLGF